MPVFHSILSFHPDEKPSDEVMMEIARKYLERLGIVNTQFAVTKHTDKAQLCICILSPNLVNNEGKAISDSWIGLRGKKVAQQLTQEYNLIPAVRKDLSRTHLEALSKSEAIKYKIYEAIAKNLPNCATMDELEERLLKLGIGIQYKYKGPDTRKAGDQLSRWGMYVSKAARSTGNTLWRGCRRLLPNKSNRNWSQSKINPRIDSLYRPAKEKFLIKHATPAPTSGSEISPVPPIGAKEWPIS